MLNKLHIANKYSRVNKIIEDWVKDAREVSDKEIDYLLKW